GARGIVECRWEHEPQYPLHRGPPPGESHPFAQKEGWWKGFGIGVSQGASSSSPLSGCRGERGAPLARLVDASSLTPSARWDDQNWLARGPPACTDLNDR